MPPVAVSGAFLEISATVTEELTSGSSAYLYVDGGASIYGILDVGASVYNVVSLVDQVSTIIGVDVTV